MAFHPRHCSLVLLTTLGCRPQSPPEPPKSEKSEVQEPVEDEQEDEPAPEPEEVVIAVELEEQDVNPEAFGERRARVPDVGLSPDQRADALDKDIIRRVVRQHITTIHNGQLIVDVKPETHPLISLRKTSGFLGLQNHSTVVRFRNIRIAPAR